MAFLFYFQRRPYPEKEPVQDRVSKQKQKSNFVPSGSTQLLHTVA